MSKLIAIAGPAAVGKSTIAKGLQATFAENGDLWLAIELDAFGRSLSREWIAIGAHRGRHAERGYAYRRGTDGGIELALGPDGRRVLAAFHRSVAAAVRSGVNVICETIVFDSDDWSDWSEALNGLSVLWVRLDAPLAVLEAREKARSPMFQGLARGMSARAPVGVFDLEVDTAAEDTAAIVQRIVAGL